MSEIKGVNRFKFHEGKVEEFKRLSAQAMDIVRLSLQALPLHAETARWLRRACSRICGHPTTQVGQERDRLTYWDPPDEY